MTTVVHCNALIDDALAKGATLVCGCKAGIEAFTALRWITMQTTPRHYPF
jgi:hypothetical protein